MISTKSAREIELMREAGDILIEVFACMERMISPGVTTLQLDEAAADIIAKRQAKAAFLGYGGFPATLCTSVNEELIHGIPSNRVLKNGDVLSIDVGAVYHGYYSDAARTYPVGIVSTENAKLIEVTEASFFAGLKYVRVGNRLGDISAAIGKYLSSFGYSTPLEYSGHGIGSALHEEPAVANYGSPGKGPLLKAGMVLAIEPMVMTGKAAVEVLADNWTVVTKDRSWCAHYENTVLITESGSEILTK